MEQMEDRFSNLPKFILHKILSRLPEKDAARTCLLSKAWLEIWYTFPILSFSDTKISRAVPQPVEDLPGKSKDFIEYVKSTLLRFWNQRLVIKEFNLRVDCFELSSMSVDVDICLKLASENGVQVLELRNGPYRLERDQRECYVLPEKVIENQTLTKLSLMGGIKVDPTFMNQSIKFFSLRELYLLEVHFEDEQSIEHFISCCPLIEFITLVFDDDGMESLRMHGLQKLKTVHTVGIKELYIDEALSLENLNYYCEYLHIPFKIDSIQCQNLKELFLSLNSSTIITNKWFLELFQKFRFLESLELRHCKTSEKINISSVQLKFLKLSLRSNLKEANIDAPNLLSCGFSLSDGSKPTISFLRISSKLEVQIQLSIQYFDVCYVRDLLRNIKPQNISISLYLSLYCRAVVSMN
jgi:hypothetical protein